jgi:hypothetical protein
MSQEKIKNVMTRRESAAFHIEVSRIIRRHQRTCRGFFLEFSSVKPITRFSFASIRV